MVQADVPDIQYIQDISPCPKTCKLKVQIRHANPTSTHYIDRVELEVDGHITPYTLEVQTTDPFTVELGLFKTPENSNIKARAHCTVHGWGTWFNINIETMETLESTVNRLETVKKPNKGVEETTKTVTTSIMCISPVSIFSFFNMIPLAIIIVLLMVIIRMRRARNLK